MPAQSKKAAASRAIIAVVVFALHFLTLAQGVNGKGLLSRIMGPNNSVARNVAATNRSNLISAQKNNNFNMAAAIYSGGMGVATNEFSMCIQESAGIGDTNTALACMQAMVEFQEEAGKLKNQYEQQAARQLMGTINANNKTQNAVMLSNLRSQQRTVNAQIAKLTMNDAVKNAQAQINLNELKRKRKNLAAQVTTYTSAVTDIVRTAAGGVVNAAANVSEKVVNRGGNLGVKTAERVGNVGAAGIAASVDALSRGLGISPKMVVAVAVGAAVILGGLLSPLGMAIKSVAALVRIASAIIMMAARGTAATAGGVGKIIRAIGAPRNANKSPGVVIRELKNNNGSNNNGRNNNAAAAAAALMGMGARNNINNINNTNNINNRTPPGRPPSRSRKGPPRRAPQ